MSHYNNQELDFVCRTKKIIKQYDSFQIEKAEKFEVTLLLNCLVGLLILPQQHWFNSLPTNLISQKEWGINPNHIPIIKKDGKDETKNVQNIARHLRNSIGHYRFRAFENRSTEISSIQFEDFDRQKNKTFEAIIPISGIRQFTTKLTDVLINEIEKNK